MSNVLQVYSIFDLKGNDYGIPFFCLSDGVAQRAFCDIVADPSCLLARHPEDYHLYHLGVFSSCDGVFNSTAPRFVCSGSDVSHAARAVLGRIAGMRGAGDPSPCPSATCSEDSSDVVQAKSEVKDL